MPLNVNNFLVIILVHINHCITQVRNIFIPNSPKIQLCPPIGYWLVTCGDRHVSKAVGDQWLIAYKEAREVCKKEKEKES